MNEPIDISIKNPEPDIKNIIAVSDLFGINYLNYNTEAYTTQYAEKNVNYLGLVLAMNQFERYPGSFDAGYYYLSSFIRELKKYGKVSFVYVNYEHNSAIPGSLLLNVRPNVSFQSKDDLWVWIGEISDGNKDNFLDCKQEDIINGIVPLIDSVRIFFDISNTKVVNFINSLEKESYAKYRSNQDSYVEMIIQTIHGLATQKVKFDFEYNNADLDLHYGDGFSQFHQKLINRMVNKDKGIVMLHGPPGNGKTHYIRRLLPALNTKNKRVILIPKYILGSLETPAFNQFMLQNFVGQKIVFVMEDAESVIVKRQSDGGNRSELVSTLLNITDGLLNDVFNIQVILTFNTSLTDIDDALLRTGRLLAKHEFANIGYDQAQSLAKHLKIVLPNQKSEYTLAEIYGLLDTPEDTDVLINQIKKKAKSLGFD